MVKIYVNALLEKAEDCPFAFLPTDYKNPKWACKLGKGGLCRVARGRQCIYLAQGVSQMDLLFA